METTHVQVAAERGYPSTLLGFTPNYTAYWREPGLPWALQLLHADYAEFEFTTDEMAPRFPVGTLVVIEPVRTHEALQVGRVYVLLQPADTDYPQVGRLARVGPTALVLTQDNSPVGLRWPLAQPAEPPANLYLVTHYSEYPTDQHHPVPTPEGDAYLIELATDEMAPRYPRHSRYVVRAVSADQWAQARGVHALEMRSGAGSPLVRRIVDCCLGWLTLQADRTGATTRLALADVTALWEVGEGDYMPRESEADRQWWLQRPGYAPTPDSLAQQVD